MLSLEESLKILKETNALIEGHFILSSGLHSPKYVQCAQLMSKPDKAIKICESLASKIKNEFNDFDLILSPAMGGIIIGYELGRILNKQTIFSERVNEEFKLRRDFKIKKGNKVLIVEDVKRRTPKMTSTCTRETQREPAPAYIRTSLLGTCDCVHAASHRCMLARMLGQLR